jgi:BCD family chlorophyll transporter-like MFS transporter
MIVRRHRLAAVWARIGTRFLPFADSASPEIPLGQLLRLSLFQVSVGVALVLLNSTLNRVMIVEMHVAATLVAGMISLPILVAPLRLILGHRSDFHRSYLGWRRVPYIWMGTMLQFGGLAIMPFALIVLSGDAEAPAIVGYAAAALAFLLVGAGLHTTQTAGLALANDLAPSDRRHRVVALLYVMLLAGMFTAAIAFSFLLANFSQIRLIQVIQGAAALTMVLNIIALWKQEPRRPALMLADVAPPPFLETWRALWADRRCRRLLLAVGLGTAGFSMQDILLEPYGGEVLRLSVSATTFLTAISASGMLIGFALSARALDGGRDTHMLAASGLLIGIPAFCAVVFSAPLQSPLVFQIGAFLIGLGGGLFSVGTLTAAMHSVSDGASGRMLGAWGTAQAVAAGTAMALSGPIRDGVGFLAEAGLLGAPMQGPASGYMVVYHIEIALMFLGLAAIGPLVRYRRPSSRSPQASFGLAEHPG